MNNKTDSAHTAQNDTFNFTPLFGSDELKLQTTPKAVTPFAGMVSFFAWLGALEFPKRVAAVMLLEYRSPNAIAPEQTLGMNRRDQLQTDRGHGLHIDWGVCPGK